MISPTNEQLIPINKVPQYLEKLSGRKPHVASLYRWIARGIAGIQLETLVIGGGRFTSIEALDRFFQETTKAKTKDRSLGHDKGESLRKQRIEAEANRLGI